MDAMKYTIEAVVGKYPEVKIGVLVGKGLKNERSHPDIEKYKSESIEVAIKKVGDAPVSQQANIASWREMYRSFGTKASEYHSSIEALTRRISKTRQLPTINIAVDVYNCVSLRYMVPVGGFNMDLVEGDIAVRFSPGNEAFTGLGIAEKEYTYSGEAVYADSNRILTRRWNFRDCVETMITEATTNLVMFIDGSPEMPRDEVEKALSELSDRLESYCGGSYSRSIADGHNPVVRID